MNEFVEHVALYEAADRAAEISSLLNKAGELARQQGDPLLMQEIGTAAIRAWQRVYEFAEKTGREIEAKP